MTPHALRHGLRVATAAVGALAITVAACAPAVSPSPSTSVAAPSAGVGPIEGPAIAFHSDPDGHDDFYLVGADGQGLQPLTHEAETVAFPVWSPDGGKIAYLCCGGFDASLWVMNADGTAPRRLTTGPAGSPAWSPDGATIAYDDHDDGGIWLVRPDGSGVKRLAADSGGASWSPDDRKLVFFSWRDFPGQEQRNELYLMAADGSNQVRLTDNEAEDVEPSWSPDGSRIVFTSSRDGNPEVYVAAADGTGQRRLTTDPAPDEGPSWSPDGTRIVYSSYRDGADPLTLGKGNAEIFTIAPDGSARTNLTSRTEWDGYPAWSPDGRQIAFSINDGVDFDLYVMNADGRGRRLLAAVAGTNGIANDCCPAWRP
jgi:Tol biopolymer transport system component